MKSACYNYKINASKNDFWQDVFVMILAAMVSNDFVSTGSGTPLWPELPIVTFAHSRMISSLISSSITLSQTKWQPSAALPLPREVSHLHPPSKRCRRCQAASQQVSRYTRV